MGAAYTQRPQPNKILSTLSCLQLSVEILTAIVIEYSVMTPNDPWLFAKNSGEHNKAQFIARMFARVSRRYDFLNTVITAGLHYQWRAKVATLVAGKLTGPALDVATGTGEFAFALAKNQTLNEIIGIDFVQEMVALGRIKANRQQLHQKVTFLQANALCLPFADNTFACVTSGFAMRNVVNVSIAISEMTRVVRPGGRIAILEIVPVEGTGMLKGALRCYFRRLVPILGGVLSGDREAYRYLPRSVDNFQSADDLVKILEGEGLRVTHARKIGSGIVTMLIGEKQPS